jgi:phage terminase large subunit-like protein
MVTWALFASPRKLRGVVAAGDEDQANLLRDAIDIMLRLNPWLSYWLEVQKGVVLNPRTGSRAEFMSSDAATSYGITPDFIICDELTHWSSQALWDSLFSAAAKRPHCLLLVITNAGFEKSWQWPIREKVMVDPAWYFHRLDGPQASWISADTLAEQRRILPAVAYARLWLNIWSSGGGDAISPDLLQAAMLLTGPSQSPDPEWIYLAGLDLGIRRDASALVVIGKHVGGFVGGQDQPIPPDPDPLSSVLTDLGFVSKPDKLTSFQTRPYVLGTGRLKLAEVRIWKPAEHGGTVKIEDVGRAVRELHDVFRFRAVACDPWQARFLIEQLQASGVPAKGIEFTGPNLKGMAEATMSAFTERQIELFGSSELVADLAALRVVEKSYGVRLESPRGRAGGTGHGDTATALSLALFESRGHHENVQTRTRPLVMWPA